MNGNKSWLGRMLVVAAVIFLGSTAPLSAQSVVKIGFVPSESFAPLFVAHERGYFKAQGLSTELVRLPSGAAILTQVSTGDIQVGGGALGAAGFNAANQKLPVAFVAPMHFAYVEDYLVIRKAEIDAGRFKSVADLRGKPCAINAKGVATEWVLDEVLKPGGIRIDNVDVKTLPFPEMLPALDNGAIVCGIVTEPFATQAEEKNIGVRPLKAKPGAKPVPITVAFWNSDWAKKNDSGDPPDVQRVRHDPHGEGVALDHEVLVEEHQQDGQAADAVEARQVGRQARGHGRDGAGSPNRTDDLPLTRRLLYQLSYAGE